jgi:hypothetical protein
MFDSVNEMRENCHRLHYLLRCLSSFGETCIEPALQLLSELVS